MHDDGPACDFDQLPKSVGRFELQAIIGQGSFGSVWKAYDPVLDRYVAVKIPRQKELDPVEAELFLREARTAAQVQHPNVVAIHEVDRDGDFVYLVTDLIEGESLAARCAREPTSIAESVSIIRTIAVALAHVHECGVVHRDLKPSNILLDKQGTPYLGDFGLARRIHEDVTLTLEGQLVGTPAYMSPEQAKGDAKQIDQLSDVYCLGVVLYELLTGQLPFRGSPHTIIDQVVNKPPTRVRSLAKHVPVDLETICLKCLRKKPKKRFLSANELAVDLDRYLRGLPILSRRTTMMERSWLWSRRHPWVTALILLAIISVASVSRIRSAQQDAAKNAFQRKQQEARAAEVERNAEIWVKTADQYYHEKLLEFGPATAVGEYESEDGIHFFQKDTNFGARGADAQDR